MNAVCGVRCTPRFFISRPPALLMNKNNSADL